MFLILKQGHSKQCNKYETISSMLEIGMVSYKLKVDTPYCIDPRRNCRFHRVRQTFCLTTNKHEGMRYHLLSTLNVDNSSSSSIFSSTLSRLNNFPDETHKYEGPCYLPFYHHGTHLSTTIRAAALLFRRLYRSN